MNLLGFFVSMKDQVINMMGTDKLATQGSSRQDIFACHITLTNVLLGAYRLLRRSLTLRD